MNNLLDALIAAKLAGGSGGGGGADVTPASVINALEHMSDSQKEEALDALNAESVFIVTFSKPSVLWEADKTLEQVHAAVQAGKTLLFRIGNLMTYAFYFSDNTTYGYEAHLVTTLDGIVPYRYDLFLVNMVGAVVAANELTCEKMYNVSGTTPTITPSVNFRYNCGTLTSLTITNPPATGSYSIVFTSGATATTTNIPSSILGLESFAAEANTTYEINVLDNRAVIGSWEVSA